VFRQECDALEVVVVDNASTDGTREILAGFDGRVRVILNSRNTGFAAAQNQAVALTRSHWVLTLNPDVLLLPGFIARLVEAGQLDRRVGTVCGRLLRIGPGFTPLTEARIDSTGIYFTSSLRHFDRGWNEPDDGRYREAEYVFGASAAAALYRREMIADISLDDGFFDPDFFSFREDADIAWRAQLLGWRCLYVPAASGYHVRRVVPNARRSLPSFINMHSVKNRFLMRVKNMTADLYRRVWLPATARDVLVAGACLFSEPGSLPAFWHLARGLPAALEKRRHIMRRRRVSDDYLASWFSPHPTARPVSSEVAVL
jgi:GT2 family glycosyltransferase